MKMRKKLAALLAAAMIASVMPMTAFAASTNRVDKQITAKKGDPLDRTTAPELKIVLKDTLAKDRVFYLELENSEWPEYDATFWSTQASADVTLRRIDGKVLEVKATDAVDEISIPLLAKLTGGEAIVTVDSNDTVVTAGKYVFATSNDTKAKAKVGDVPTFAGVNEVAEMAEITFEESYIGAFKATEEKKVTIELNDDNFTFTNGGNLDAVKSFKAADNKEGVVSTDGQKVTFTIDAGDFVAAQRGSLKLSGLKVKANKKAVQGDVEVYINGYFFDAETVVAAKYGDFSTTLTTEKVEEVKAGTKQTLKFTLAEVVSGAINADRTTSFTLSKDIVATEVKLNGKVIASAIDAKDKNIFDIVDFKATRALDDKKAKFEVKVEIPAKFEGDISVQAEGRSLEESKELKLAEVTAPVTVEVEAMKVAVGTQGNVGGKITITEADKGVLARGKNIVIQLPKDLKDEGVEFTNVKDIVLETTGGIRVKDAVYNTTTSAIEVEVTRAGTETGTVTISGFEVKARRTIIDGAYEIEVGGNAISEIADLAENDKKDGYKNIDAITSADFILVGNVYGNAEVVFNIGSNKFTVNGKEMTMDAAAFIKDGRTMVPVRYLAYALGIDEESIKFNAGIVTIFGQDNKIIQLKNGDSNLVVNAMTIPMATAATIVEGRTYVPITEIGSIFGVQGTWDSEAQTATFK